LELTSSRLKCPGSQNSSEPIDGERIKKQLDKLEVQTRIKRKKSADGSDVCSDDDNPRTKTIREGEDYLDDDIGLSNIDAQTYTVYAPRICNHVCLKPHPDKLVETTSLHSVSTTFRPAVSVKLSLPSRALIDGLLTNILVELYFRSLAQHESYIPNGRRCGFYMGDGAGVGKGRQQAAIIFHNFLHGWRKALWISMSAYLIDDARRDVREIGTAISLNATTSSRSVRAKPYQCDQEYSFALTPSLP
jgi:hypothetical protein